MKRFSNWSSDITRRNCTSSRLPSQSQPTIVLPNSALPGIGRIARHAVTCTLLGLFCFLSQSNSSAQQGSLIDELNKLAAENPVQDVGDPVTLEAMFKLDSENSRTGTLIVSAEIKEHWHLYSITQPLGGPIRSRINVNDSDLFTIIGDFTAHNPPHTTKDHPDFTVNVEDHSDHATWSAPIELKADTKAEKLKIEIVFNGQACLTQPDGKTGQCLLVKYDDLVATFAGSDPQPGEFQADQSHVKLSGRIFNAKDSAAAINAGDTVKMEIKARPTDNFHLYAYAPSTPEKAIINPTLIAITKQNGWKMTGPVASPKLDSTLPLDKRYHTGEVTWAYEFKIPPADPSNEKKPASFVTIAGMIGYQACTDSSCDFPSSAEFQAKIPLGDQTKRGPVPMGFAASQASHGDISEAALRMQRHSKTAPAKK